MVRELFWAITRSIDSGKSLPVPSETEKHSDIHVTINKSNIRVDFYWDPYLNSTGFEHAFNIPEDVEKSAITIVGTGLWFAKNVLSEPFAMWKVAIDDLVLASSWRRKEDATSDLFIMLPVLEPDWTRLSSERKSIKPDVLSRMNCYLENISAKNLANVALSFKDMLSTASPDITHDKAGLHLVDEVTSAQAQLLINLRCNDNLPKKFPFDSTCCYKYPPPNYQQLIFFASVLLVIPIVYHFQSQDLLHKSYIPSEFVLQALFIFGLALVYAYFTDRTHLFGKEAKHFSLEQFLFLIFITAIVGYFTAETSEKDQPFLSRDQTDEWKGWMQILILIYHYLGASKIPWIYNVIRVLVAMYLFMTGFGHTIFFYKKADYSFKRVVTVLIRLNLLNVVLAYTMNTDYLFYYFSPLVSFWFGIIWITMWISYERNSDIKFLGIKIGISAVIVTAFTKTPGILEFCFLVLRVIARIHWDAVEWRFRVGLDIWIVYIGMIVAILFIKSSELTNSQHWQYYRTIGLGISMITIPVYFLFEATRESKFVYNHWHPYISLFPILAFIVLRNASTRLRNTHSTAFAFIGQCSLETFILQFHIWLAGDTKGVLVVIGPSQWRWVSFILGTVVFIFICWKVAAVTGTITQWILGNQKKHRVPPVIVVAPVSPTSLDGKEQNHDDVKTKLLAEIGESSLPVPVNSIRQLSFGEKLGRVMGVYWEDLRLRIGIILISLWLLNWVFSLFYFD